MRRNRRKRSLFQVVMMMNITSASSNGSQPPENSFRALAENIGTSIISKITRMPTAKKRFQCQFLIATEVTRILVNTMVPVTAIPYAAARLLECSKPIITSTTAIYSVQLITGM
ncbi:hypothetical protein D3C75_1114830 [compost metagenome]